jgi:adenosine kinase
MTALICGSMAYDTVMTFEGRFPRAHPSRPYPQAERLVSDVPRMRRNFGGCAGNIAYNLKLLGGDGLIMATVGHDFAPYAAWLARHGLPGTYLRDASRRSSPRRPSLPVIWITTRSQRFIPAR